MDRASLFTASSCTCFRLPGGMNQKERQRKPFSFLYPRRETQILLTDEPPADFASLKRLLLRRVNDAVAGSSHYTFTSLQDAIQSLDQFMQQIQRSDFTFFRDLIPHVHKWARMYEDADGEIPLLQAGAPETVNMTRQRIRLILSNAFFLNTLSLRHEMALEKRHFGDISLLALYNSKTEIAKQRILCLLAYFAQAVDLHAEEVVGFERHRFCETCPDWSSLDVKIDVGRIRVHTERMENSDALCFMDFANKKLHIHKIIPSATQEEVLFSACPEAFVGILISEEMQDSEILIMRNMRRFSDYEGYSYSFRFAGFYPTLRVHDILAVDATPVNHFTKAMVDRDLNKAYLAFAAASQGSVTKVATSHWGCGAFGGEKHLKFLQQVCGSALAGIFLDYSTFGDVVTESSFKHLLNIIASKQLTIGTVYDVISGFKGQKGAFLDHVAGRLGTR